MEELSIHAVAILKESQPPAGRWMYVALVLRRLSCAFTGGTANSSFILVSHILVHLPKESGETPGSLARVSAVPSEQLLIAFIRYILSGLFEKDGMFRGLEMSLSTNRVHSTRVAFQSARPFVRHQLEETLCLQATQ